MELKTNKFNEMTLEEMRGTDGGTKPVVILPVVPYFIARAAAEKVAAVIASLLK